MDGDGRRFDHIAGIDGLRAIAIGAVIAHHGAAFLAPGLAATVARGGFLGVDLFFVVSGFLITSLLLQERVDHGDTAVGAFYARRALRLLPALVPFLVVHAIAFVGTGRVSLGLEARSILIVVFYVSDIVQARGIAFAAGLGHTWSLAVEEQFYLVWPLAFLAVADRRRLFVRIVLPAAIAVAIVARLWLWHNDGFRGAYVNPIARADALLIGVGTAYLWRWRAIPGAVARGAGWAGLAVFALAVAVADPTDGYLYDGGFTVIALAGAAMVVATADGSWWLQRALASGPAQAIGRVSYGLYLWHFPVFVFLSLTTPGWAAPVRTIVGLATTVAATQLSWRFVERPALAAKSRWSRSHHAVG